MAAISSLHALTLSQAVQQNISDYVSLSTNPIVHEGLERLLEKDRQAEFKRLKHAAKRIKIDGRAKDWSTRTFAVGDRWNEWYPIKAGRKIRKKRAAFDTTLYGFASDGRYLYVMSKPRVMPRNQKYYFAINLMSSASRPFYSIAWADNASYVNVFNEADGSWKKSFVPRGMKSAKGRVFEARVPLRALKKLPGYYHPTSVAWDEAYNAYNYITAFTPQSSLPEKFRNYALELFARYAERRSFTPDNPLPIAQALADAYIYRMSEDRVRDTVVSDGILMLEEAEKTESYSFPDQQKLSKLGLNQIISWSNRASLYGIENNTWRFRKILSRNGGKFSEAIYKFLFLDPAVFNDARALISRHDLIVPGDLPATLWKIEETFANNQHYRASLDFLRALAELLGTEYWRKMYEEARYEEENNLHIITEVDGVPVYRGLNWSAGFQVRYFNENGTHYGNCGDVTAMSLAVAKALGIPALHIHYDVIDDYFYREIHSFPAYYSSAENRYMGFRTGYNMVWDWTKSGREGLKVLYRYELPVYEWFSQFYDKPLPGTKVWSASNFKFALVSLEEWESFNSGGFSTASVRAQIHDVKEICCPLE